MLLSVVKANLKHIARRPHFWIIVLLFIIVGLSHYHDILENVPVIGRISTSIFFGTERHTVDRLFFLLLIVYAGWALGVRASAVVLVASFAVMLPRAILISPSPQDAIFETVAATIAGALLLPFIAAWCRAREERDELSVALEKLRISEENYRDLFENASDGIWIHDMDGNITAANRAAERFSGYTAEEMVGRNVADFFADGTREIAREVKRKLLQGEPIGERYEQKFRRADGTEVMVELTTRLITQRGQPAAFQHIARDVTEQKRIQQERERTLHQLDERVKELNCLYGIHEIEKRFNISLEEFFAEVAELIPQSWQYPKITCVCITYRGVECKTENFKRTEWALKSDLIIRNEPVGSLEICYTEERPDRYQGPFIEEEVRLADSIAKHLGSFAERKQAEEELRESREILRFLFESIGEGIIIIDLDGNVVEVNDAALRIQGYKSKEEVVGRHSLDFMVEEDRPRAMEDIRRAIDEGHGTQYEYRLRTRDGRLIDIQASATLLHDSAGNPVGLISAIRDITESKRAREQLQEERNRAQIYLDIAEVIFLVIGADEEVVLINKKGCEVLGCEEEGIIGKNWFENFTPPYAKDKLKSIFDRLIAGELEPVEYYENPVLTRDGDERLIAWHNTLLRDEAGKVIATLSSGEDITEYRKADEALRKSERRYRDLFNSASDAIIIRDLDGNIFEVNESATELTGYTVEELTNMNILQFLTPESFEITMDKQKRQLEGEEASQRYELELIRKDGTRATIEAVITVVSEDGKPAAVQATVRDVTEQRRLRDSIRFYLQKVLVAQEEERKRVARDLHDDTSQSLLLLTHQLDAIASDSGGIIPKPTRNQLNQLHGLAVETLNNVRRYAQELRPAILDDMGMVAALEWMADQLSSEDQIEAEVQVSIPDTDLPHEVKLVLFRIAQEAVTNIKKHAEASKVVIRLESGEEKIRMTINDNGKGFEVPSPLNSVGDVGKLGIIGMLERAELLGGTLSIESNPNRGTMVSVEIPYTK
jgi:two-component system sensor histidine kinase DegS